MSAWAQYTIRTPRRDEVQKYLAEAGVPTAVHYPIPLHMQPAVQDIEACLPVGVKLAEVVMSLPMGPALSERDANLVVALLAEILPTLSPGTNAPAHY